MVEGLTNGPALFAQVQFVDQFFVTIGFCFAQIIEQAPALRDHFKQAAARRVIFPVGLKVLSQMLYPAGKKCDLHIRAAGILRMQLELLKIRRLVALCHNEGAILDEDRILATTHGSRASAGTASFVCPVSFALAVVPKAQSPARRRHAAPVQDHGKEVT